MQLDIGSDLHLWFDTQQVRLPAEPGDVLVLAGDIIEVEILRANSSQREINRKNEVLAFFREAATKYKKVIWVFGNHEFYGSNIYTAVYEAREILKDEAIPIEILENDYLIVNDTMFFGATTWTDLSNPVSALIAHGGMSDYELIQNGGWILTPADTTRLFQETKKRLMDFIQLETDLKKVYISHHAPSSLSIKPPYVGSNLNPAYANDLGTVLAYSDIKLSVHGHIHAPSDYMLGDCQVIANPRGYYGSEQRATNFEFKRICL